MPGVKWLRAITASRSDALEAPAIAARKMRLGRVYRVRKVDGYVVADLTSRPMRIPRKKSATRVTKRINTKHGNVFMIGRVQKERKMTTTKKATGKKRTYVPKADAFCKTGPRKGLLKKGIHKAGNRYYREGKA